jgi:Asp/Glu/hydantoin racemase
MRIACLHTAESNVAIFEASCRGMDYADVNLKHEVRADLLAQVEQDNGLTSLIEEKTLESLLALSIGADAVVLTCSSLGPVVAKAAQRTSVPILRVDAAMAREAVRGGGRVVALCALAATLEPTRTLFEAAAQATQASIEVRLVPSAWDLFKAGQRDRYLALIAEAADHAFEDGTETVALAQASMAQAVELCRSGQPLTSPAAGLKAAIAAATISSRAA